MPQQLFALLILLCDLRHHMMLFKTAFAAVGSLCVLYVQHLPLSFVICHNKQI